MPVTSAIILHHIGVFAKAIKQEKTIRLVRTGKEEANFVDNVIVFWKNQNMQCKSTTNHKIIK